METKESARAALDDYGVTYCEKCGAELLCNECGDMTRVPHYEIKNGARRLYVDLYKTIELND